MTDSIFANLQDLNTLTVFVRLILATLMGGIIGLDRDRKSRAAGMRTHMVVSLGAAIAMITNEYMIAANGGQGDPTRMGAQVISGIGFLGAGTILVRKNDKITGLTTAAGLWATATIGLAIGSGFYELAILGGLFLATVMIMLLPIKDALSTGTEEEKIMSIVVYSVNGLRNFMHYTAEYNLEIVDLVIENEFIYSNEEREGTVFYVQLKTTDYHNKRIIIEELSHIDGIKYVSEI